MEDFKTLIERDDIQERISQMAEQINEDYKGKKITLICILKGALYIFADLSRKLNLDAQLCFMRVSSYVGEKSSGKIDIKVDLTEDIKGKDVLIIEDLIDSGNTLYYLKEYLQKKEPNSIKICTILDKPDRREKKELKVDYVGFTIPDYYVVGYGMDADESYRTLEDIKCKTKESDVEFDKKVKAIKLQLKKDHK